MKSPRALQVVAGILSAAVVGVGVFAYLQRDELADARASVKRLEIELKETRAEVDELTNQASGEGPSADDALESLGGSGSLDDLLGSLESSGAADEILGRLDPETMDEILKTLEESGSLDDIMRSLEESGAMDDLLDGVGNTGTSTDLDGLFDQ